MWSFAKIKSSLLLISNPSKFFVKKGERIAQMVVCPIQQVIIEEVNELSETNRGIGGFGSTGTK